MRAWRAAHPEYRDRERQRRHEAKRARRLERDRREVDELVARLASVDRPLAHSRPGRLRAGFARVAQ
jgi:hypothetical protein